jgi:hypothetical protein
LTIIEPPRTGRDLEPSEAILVSDLKLPPGQKGYTGDVLRRVQMEWSDLRTSPPRTLADLQPDNFTPPPAADVPAVIRAMTGKYGRDGITDLYVTWRLVQSLKNAPPAALTKEAGRLAAIYRALPPCLPPDKITPRQVLLRPAGQTRSEPPSRNTESTGEANDRSGACVFYTALTNQPILALPRLLLGIEAEPAAHEIAGQVARVCQRHNVAVCDLLDAIAQRSQNANGPLPPHTAEVLAQELARMVRSQKAPAIFFDFTQLQTSRQRPLPTPKRIALADFLNQTLAQLNAKSPATQESSPAAPKTATVPPPPNIAEF